MTFGLSYWEVQKTEGLRNRDSTGNMKKCAWTKCQNIFLEAIFSQSLLVRHAFASTWEI